MKTIMICAAMICAVTVARAERGSDADETAYEKALNAIEANKFVFVATTVSTTEPVKSDGGMSVMTASMNGYAARPSSIVSIPTKKASTGNVFILLQDDPEGGVACIQGVPIMARVNKSNADRPQTVSITQTSIGIPKDVRTRVKRNGTVEKSMRVTNYENNAIYREVYITMKKGSNLATATVGKVQLTGYIVPVDEAEIFNSGTLSALNDLNRLRNWSK